MKILLDVDGVLADLTGEVIHLLQINGYQRTVDDVTNYSFSKVFLPAELALIDRYAHRTGFCSSLSWYPNAISFLSYLKWLGDIYVVTAPWKCDTWCKERIEWLKPLVKEEDVIFTHKKYLISGDVLIEDNVDNLKDWLEEHPKGYGILIDRPWNRTYLPTRAYRSYSYLDAVNHLRGYLEKAVPAA